MKTKFLITTLLIINFQLSIVTCFSQTIAGGGEHSVSICNNGTVMTWGNNYDGELGDGTNSNSNTPVQVNGLSSVIKVAVCTTSTLALRVDSTVWAWGDNLHGQLGNGNNTDSNIPVQVSSLNGVIAIAGGVYHSLALKNDGTVWAWGENEYGELGIGNNTYYSNIPVQVSSLTGVIAIAGGGTHASMALKNDGTVWEWGYSSNVPIQVSALNGVIAIAGGDSHSLALKNDGIVWAWGNNYDGQLGNGTNISSASPVKVSSLNSIIAISGGYSHSLALKNDGTVWAWGGNGYGELGDSTNTATNIPEQITALNGITAITAAIHHSYALKNDSTVWGCGGNWSTGNNVPMQVIGLCPVLVPDNCIAYYTTSYDSTLNTFNLAVDSSTMAMATSYHWDFGDGTTSTLASPTHVYTVDSLYNVCMKIYTATGDSCTYCHIIGKDTSGNIIRNGGFTLNVNNAITTGISQNHLVETKIEIYPNPSSGVFTIQMNQFENVQLKIYNILGECIHQQICTFAYQQMNLTDQPNGIYFINIHTTQGILSKKIILNR